MTTLLGVPGFPARRHSETELDTAKTIVDGMPLPNFELAGTPLFVTPATVAAIAKAKGRSTDPTIKVALDAPPLSDDEQRRARAFTKRKAERAEAFAKLKSQQLPDRRTDQVRAPSAPQKWDTFEDLGLAPRPVTKKAQKLVVSTYRLLGFGILTLIVVVLLGYIGTTAFYFLNTTWVTPIALSANDEKVVALQSQLAAQLNEREKLVQDLAESERAINAEQQFQMQFAKAIKKDAAGRRLALERARDLAMSAASTRSKIRATNEEFSQSAASKMETDYNARLIDQNSMIAGKAQLAQISSANLSLAERQAEFDQRADELASQTASLDAILADKTATASLSYDVLKIARDYEASKLAVAREMGNRSRLQSSLARQDKIIEGLQQSAYLRAVSNNATVALVPYDNLKNIEKGTPLYACKLNMLICREVGKVLDILPGEVQVQHPTRENVLRGRMIEMQMSEPGAAQKEVLFAGGAPLML